MVGILLNQIKKRKQINVIKKIKLTTGVNKENDFIYLAFDYFNNILKLLGLNISKTHKNNIPIIFFIFNFYIGIQIKKFYTFRGLCALYL